MKRFEITANGLKLAATASRMTVEAGALVLYAARDENSRDEITAAWGPGEWTMVLALDERDRPISLEGGNLG